MPTPKAADLKITLVATGTSGEPLPEFTAAAGCTTEFITTTAAITNPAGGIGRFSATTTTAALRGLPFHARGVPDAGDPNTIQLGYALPVAPSAGDVFAFAASGSARTSTLAPLLLVGGQQPEQAAVACSNITGLEIRQAAGLLGPGTLTLAYTASTTSLTIAMGSDTPGDPVDLMAASSPATIYAADGQSYVIVAWNAVSLPSVDASDAFTLDRANGVIVADVEGYESGEGALRYFAVSLGNGAAFDTVQALTVYCIAPDGTATTIAAESSLGLAEGTVTLTDATDWPAAGFWLYNDTQDDIRYCSIRSGNDLLCLECNLVALTGNGTTAPAIGDTLTGSLSNATAKVLASRAGRAVCLILDGTFVTGDVAGALGTLSAVVRGHRGKTATTWGAGDTVRPIGHLDLGQDLGTIATVTDRRQTPAGVTLATATAAAPLSLGDLSAAQSQAIWIEQWTPRNSRAVADVLADLVFEFE